MDIIILACSAPLAQLVVATAKRCPLAEKASRSAAAATQKISSESEEFFDVAKVSSIKAWI